MTGNTVHIELPDGDAERLRRLADRSDASADALASTLLRSALETTDLDPHDETTLITSIPGALESIERGKAQIADGNTLVPDELR